MSKLLIPILLLVSSAVFAEGPGHGAGHAPGGIKLSQGLRALLSQEMIEIKKDMSALSFAVASGNWADIQAVGSAIRDGYIMKNKLTDEQKHELHSALPNEFKELDQRFHHYAGMLSHVAEEGDIELVNYFVYKMNEVCTACHAKYARHKFPGFAKANKHLEHAH